MWRPSLRERLVEMRDDLIDRMARRGSIEPGLLPQLGGIAAALRMLDQSADEATSVVVDDTDGLIKLIVYRDGAAIAAMELRPTAAIRLGGELLDAAGLRLADELEALRAKASR